MSDATNETQPTQADPSRQAPSLRRASGSLPPNLTANLPPNLRRPPLAQAATPSQVEATQSDRTVMDILEPQVQSPIQPQRATPPLPPSAFNTPTQTSATPPNNSFNTATAAPPQAPMPAGMMLDAIAAQHAPAPVSPPPTARRYRPARGSGGSHVTLKQLVEEAHASGISDIHLGVGEVPRMRKRGDIVVTSYPATTHAVFYDWLYESLGEEQISEFEDRMELDTAIQYEGLVRCRVNVFISLLGPAMVLRLIPLTILTLEQLGLPDVFRSISDQHKGLVLVTGPTGSGKSTTLAAMVDYINKNHPKHIISIEDPIEFVHNSQKSLVRQREVGIHTREFANALKACLREDPDILLIGEMRDRETVDIALKAAQTGHLVFGTLHTNSAVKTIERLLNIYQPDEQEAMRLQIAETLVSVIAQTLVKTTDGKRAAAHEILINTDAIKDYIKRGQIDEIEALIPQSTYDGMQTMNQSLYNLYEEGRISDEVALEASPRHNEMAQLLRGRL